jgi:hypothetical protein
MSYWVSLTCPCCEQHLSVEPFEDGGTYVLGGSTEAHLNVTYNYSKHVHEALGHSLRDLDGTIADRWIGQLELAVATLGTERDPDYWKSTPGNAGAMLARLLSWAKQHPKGIFNVD